MTEIFNRTSHLGYPKQFGDVYKNWWENCRQENVNRMNLDKINGLRLVRLVEKEQLVSRVFVFATGKVCLKILGINFKWHKSLFESQCIFLSLNVLVEHIIKKWMQWISYERNNKWMDREKLFFEQPRFAALKIYLIANVSQSTIVRLWRNFRFENVDICFESRKLNPFVVKFAIRQIVIDIAMIRRNNA